MQTEKQQIHSRIRKITVIVAIIAVTLILIIVGSKRLIFYGSIFRTCNYSMRTIDVPSELRAGILTLSQAAGTVTGSGEYSCLKNFNVKGTQLVAREMAVSWYGGSKAGVLNPPQTFKVKEAYEITKHGISTIDSGPGPLYYLSVENENGQEFIIPVVATGINPEERFLEFSDGKERFIVGAESFEDYGIPKPRFRFDKNAVYDLDE